MKKFFKETEKMWNNFVNPGLKIATPNILDGVAAKEKSLNQLKNQVIF